MKSWFYSLILLSFCALLFKAILPKGEKSPLYSSLRFLIATMLIAVSFSPILPIFKKDFSITLPNIFQASENETDAIKSKILERFGEKINQTVLQNFPDAEYSLSIFADENEIPTKIEVKSDKKALSEEIATFIKVNFLIDCEPI